MEDWIDGGDRIENLEEEKLAENGCVGRIIKSIWSMLNLRCQCHTEVEVPLERDTLVCGAEQTNVG